MEKLASSLTAESNSPAKAELSAAIRQGVTKSDDLSALTGHPVVRWLETNAALDTQIDVLIRRKPQPIGALAKTLAEHSGEDAGDCLRAVEAALLWISQVNESIQKSGRRDTILPFRLHQFVSQTGSVYTTLDQGSDRFITLEPGIYKSDDSNQKPIFPNVFSRTSGHPFICVTHMGNRLLPREFMEKSIEEEQGADGYILVGDVWNPEEDLDSLPDAWFRINKSGRKPLSEKLEMFPQEIFFDELGNCSNSSPMKYRGWFMRAPLLFDPTSGTFFDPQTRESTKLAKLGSEGRSTSTTIMTFAILSQLREAGYKLADQKLLSFTDNRQDAALQAGHFNDFLQVVQLRSAIHRALATSTDHKLTYSSLGEAVFGALGLGFTEFATLAQTPEFASIQKRYEQTFQDFLLYRALADLRRSWRIVLPNLEQCALLAIEYADLEEVADSDTFWSTVPIVATLGKKQRYEFLTTILDFFRLEYAIHSTNFLEYSKMRQNEREFREKLRSPWTLDENEELENPSVVRLEPLAPRSPYKSASMGPTSALGKFIKHYCKQADISTSGIRGADYSTFIHLLMSRLVDSDFLQVLPAKSNDGAEIRTYRLKVDKIVWTLGDGKTVKHDVIKSRSFRDKPRQPNEFFAEMYRNGLPKGKRLRAEDHTGQLDKDTRLEREDRFKCEWWIDDAKTQQDIARISSDSISALFCSPTMELGVDIGGLSVVHMRNVPPNSANYAQRSGRAGRSGQGALVFTYCSTYSPHDRHYFNQQPDLVAGAVQPPRLDLCNRELLLSHLNALAISEVGLTGLDGEADKPASLGSLVAMDVAGMPLKSLTRDGLKLTNAMFDKVKSTFKRAIYDFAQDLENKGAGWYSDTWIENNLNKLADHLHDSLERWRTLYASAKSSLSKATGRIDSGVLAANSEEYTKLVKLQNQSTRQLNLLVNDTGNRFSELSEFYPYRYLASEGYLPGYNFTRLPVRVFLQAGGRGGKDGEYISRPRSIALREFAPLNIIYHNGRKYRIDQLIARDVEESLIEAKVSKSAGYFLKDDQKDFEICPFTKKNLSDAANKLHLQNLMEMAESRANEIDRISCEEEERSSRGFEIDTYFTIDGAFDRVRRAIASVADTHLLNLRYIPAARLVYVNTKWRSATTEGFPLSMTNGIWKASIPPLDEQTEGWKLVNLWTSNTSDALYIEPVQPLGLDADGVVTLQYALKRGIELEYQIEPNELGVVAVGDMKAPNILIYEASEGSLGILSRFADSHETLRRVVEKAKQLCRYDDTTYKAKASYDDLLSYYNQRDHLRIDRFAIREALEKLIACNVEVQTSNDYADYDSHYQSLLAAVDPNSSLERDFLDFLYHNNLRLPDRAQKQTTGIYCQPDFYYESRIWVFVDGSVHDKPEVASEDKKKRSELLAKGDEVIVYRYDHDLSNLVSSRPDIFRKVR